MRSQDTCRPFRPGELILIPNKRADPAWSYGVLSLGKISVQPHTLVIHAPLLLSIFQKRRKVNRVLVHAELLY